MKAKLQQVTDREYIEITDIEFIESLMYMFYFPKAMISGCFMMEQSK